MNSSHGASIIIPKVALPSEDPYPENCPTESQILLRVAPSLAQRIQQQIRLEGFPKDLAITFSSPRRAKIQFQEVQKDAVLLDLPSIIEAQKTIDKKQFYKIADICQMLVTIEEDLQGQEAENGMGIDRDLFPYSLKQIEALAYRWPHGLTPPLKHARKIRSKSSTLTLPYPNAKGLTGEEIEAIIERLLIADKEALEVSFEVQEEEQENGAISGHAGEDDISDLVADIEDNLMMKPENEEEEFEEDFEEEEGEEEGEDQFGYDQDLANEIEDSQFQDGMMVGVERELQELENEFQLSAPSESEEVEEQQQQLESEIAILEMRLSEKIQQLEQSPPNPLIRQRLSNAIQQLQQEIQSKKQHLL